MKISFLIACHNAQNNLPHLVNKLLTQDNSKIIEIVISQDDGFEYHSILPKDNRIIFSESGLNSGPSKARNRALNAATGSHICLMDSDDDISDNFINEVVKGLEWNEAIAFNTQYIKDGNIVREFNKLLLDYENLYNFYGSVHTVAPREWTKSYVDFVAEDVLATLNVIEKNGGSLKIVDADYKIVLHSESYCAKKGANFSDMYTNALKNVEKIQSEVRMLSKDHIIKLYEDRLKMSLAFDREISRNNNADYHDFVTKPLKKQKYRP